MSKETIKNKFKNGMIPDENDFGELIDFADLVSKESLVKVNELKTTTIPNLNKFLSGSENENSVVSKYKVEMSEWTLENAELSRSTDEVFWLSAIEGYYGIAYTSANKLSFTATPNITNIPGFLVGIGENTYTVVNINPAHTARVIEMDKKGTTFTVLKALDKSITPAQLNDEIAGQLDGNIFTVTIKRVGNTDFVNWFTIDLSTITGANGFNATPVFGLASSYLSFRTGADIYAMNEGGIFSLGDNLSDVVVKQSKEIDDLKDLIQNISGSDGDSRWTAKKMNILGDSFTQRNLYPPVVKNALGLATINNYGSSGDTITKHANDSSPMSVRYTSMTNDCDLVVVAGGINDYGNSSTDNNIPLGDLDSRDIETFRGAMRILIEGLLTKYKRQKIAFVTPVQMNHANDFPYYDGKTQNNAGHYLIDYVDAMIEICNEYGIPCLDMYRTFGMNELNMPEWSLDGLHLSQLGSEYYGQKVAEFLKGV